MANSAFVTHRRPATAAPQENKAETERYSNVVIIGIKESVEKSDAECVRRFFEAAGAADVVIKDLKRLRAGRNSDTSNVILISLASKDERDRVLRHCRRHELENEFKLVFAREDRSPSEQAEFNRARKQAGRRNSELRARLDQPFRFVVHKSTRQVVLIDVVESRRQRRYIIRDETDLQSLISEDAAPATFTNRGPGECVDINGVDHIVQINGDC